MTLFKNRYRIETTRLRGWDYTAPGWYFVTICTQDRVCHFGDVVEGIMQPSDMGDIVAEEWRRTEKIRPYVVLDAWVVMPNHFHGILGIRDHDGNIGDNNVGGHGNVVVVPAGRLYGGRETNAIAVVSPFVGSHHRAIQNGLHQTDSGCRVR